MKPIKILHISAECYPAAKAGGLGDVVGALPKYLNNTGVETAVIMPKHNTKWLNNQLYREIMRGSVRLGMNQAQYAIEECLNTDLGFTIYVVNCPQYFERPNIYTDENGQGFRDDVERWLTFQQAVIHWIMGLVEKPKVLHCHDYHTGLIPFMIKYCPEYNVLEDLPTVFTIHNGEYQGAFNWQKTQVMPFFDTNASGLLEWEGAINPMASAIKNCWRFTTVSPGYMEELRNNSGGLEWLMNNEWAKSVGILNGIDAQVWNPATDPLLPLPLKKSVETFKKENKQAICEKFGIRSDLPLLTFIGRIVGEKGADLLPEVISRFLQQGGAATFVILGTGDPAVSDAFRRLAFQYKDNMGVLLEYNEAMAHQLYAGSDYLLMPSRVEPCGLNQMYALRYGTVPIVRSIGGLKDTVIDFGSPKGGSGICFTLFNADDLMLALIRAMRLYWDAPSNFKALQKYIMTINNSWEKSASEYLGIYRQLARDVD
jgi:starch synthase